LNVYYSVFDPEEKKVADCGSERDAIFLIHSRNKIRDGHYYQFNPLPGEIVDINNINQLPTNNIVVHINDSESWVEVGGQKLPMQQKEPFNPEFSN